MADEVKREVHEVGGSNILLQSAPARADAGMDVPHIVVVDDDVGVRTLLARLLRESGYEVTGVECGVELRSLMQARAADLILLDITMPGDSGFDLCAELRSESDVPIIMISARGEEADRVNGLDLGADDYIAKPFGRPELLARVRAILRRRGGEAKRGRPRAPDLFHFDGWRYRPRHHELRAPTGADIDLTGAEHELLHILLRNPGRIIGRERLLELARARRGQRSDRSVDVLVSRLRSKLQDGGRARPYIRTIRGIGYMFAIDVVAT